MSQSCDSPVGDLFQVEHANMFNGQRAFVDIQKLRDYCLSATHFRGRHKARVFWAKLGLTAGHAEWLRVQLLNAARLEKAEPGKKDAFGERFVIDFEVTTGLGSAIVRSTWIILTNDDVPRLTSCFVR